jgi:VTC domain
MNTGLETLVAGFDPVGLPELERRAELQLRVDRKYIVDHDTLAELLAELGSDYVALEVDGERLQRYDSIYFDTPALMGYRHHLQGRRKRFKCRTRLYGSEACFFDLKLKGRRGQTLKHRLPLSVLDHGTLGPRAAFFLRRKLLEEYGLQAPAELEPVLHTCFSRLTLMHVRRQERLTLDFAIKTGIEGSGERYRMRPDRVLIEAKSGTGAGAVDRLLPRLGARPVTMCSKYCLGVALAHPALPTNPYKPLLRRHFDETPLPVAGATERLAA